VKTKKLKVNLGNVLFVKILLIVLTYLTVLLIFILFDFLPKTYHIKPGEISREDILAVEDGEYEDLQATERERDKAEKQAGVVYYIDPMVNSSVRKKIDEIFQKVNEVRENNDLERIEDKINWLRTQLDTIVTNKPPYYILVTLVEADDKKFEILKKSTDLIIRYVMSWHINQSQMTGAINLIEEKTSELPFSEEYSQAVEELAKSVLMPNCLIDVEETQKLKMKAREDVPPVRVSIKSGAIIVSKGHIIEASHIETLKQLDMLEKGLNFRKLLGLALLLLLIFFLLVFYIYKRENTELYTLKNIIFFSIIVIIHLILSKVFMEFSAYLICLPAVAMFLAILCDYKLAIAFSMFMSVILGLFPGSYLNLVIVSLIGSIVAVFSVSNINKRFDLITAGGVVGITNFISIMALSLIDYVSFWIMLTDCLAGFGAGFLSAFIVLGVLPIFEKYFDFIPQIRLLELSNQQEPLLQRLLMEAPGTFQHSLIVANLSEKVASELGANALLTRVGALYHDIGKIKRPTFFVENQLGENPHNKISPTLSSLIIHSHVKEGLELAQKYALPRAIQDFIPQHQGTGLVTYFYHKAKQGEYGDSVDEKDFRYPGPKPQNKEASIIMVCDCVEAASRTLEKPTPARIQGLVEKIISNILQDGQFDECDLSFKDLSIMTDVLTQTVTTMYHKRIEYPAEAKKRLETKQIKFLTRKIEGKAERSEVKEGKSKAKEGKSEAKEGKSEAKEGKSEIKEGKSEAKEGKSG